MDMHKLNSLASSAHAGLQWNLDNTLMEFGGLVSTSNRICEDVVEVSSDRDLIWTVELKD
jgi:thiamine pyrophosphokinase